MRSLSLSSAVLARIDAAAGQGRAGSSNWRAAPRMAEWSLRAGPARAAARRRRLRHDRPAGGGGGFRLAASPMTKISRLPGSEKLGATITRSARSWSAPLSGRRRRAAGCPDDRRGVDASYRRARRRHAHQRIRTAMHLQRHRQCIGVPHFRATQYLRTKGMNPQFPDGIVRSVSFVSTTDTARSLAGFVVPALALTPCWSPGSSKKLCPTL